MLDIVIDEREFRTQKPRSCANPIPLRYVSQPPRHQLITMHLWAQGWNKHYHDFYLPLPWVVYEWAYVPHINPNACWLLNAMYFSPTSLEESLDVSTPCLPNFYGNYPCCDEKISYCQEEFTSLDFMLTFWSETFNQDGDLLNLDQEPHPIWAYLAEKAGCPEYNSASEIHKVFSYWETLSIADLTSLNWPQNLRIPECSVRL